MRWWKLHSGCSLHSNCFKQAVSTTAPWLESTGREGTVFLSFFPALVPLTCLLGIVSAQRRQTCFQDLMIEAQHPKVTQQWQATAQHHSFFFVFAFFLLFFAFFSERPKVMKEGQVTRRAMNRVPVITLTFQRQPTSCCLNLALCYCYWQA